MQPPVSLLRSQDTGHWSLPSARSIQSQPTPFLEHPFQNYPPTYANVFRVSLSLTFFDWSSGGITMNCCSCYSAIRPFARQALLSLAQPKLQSALLSSNLRTWRFTSCFTCIAVIPILSHTNLVHIATPHIFKVNVNTLPTMFRSSKWCLPFKRFDQNSVHTSHLLHAYYTLRPSHSPKPMLLSHSSAIPPAAAQATAACVSSSVPISCLTKPAGVPKTITLRYLTPKIQNLEI